MPPRYVPCAMLRCATPRHCMPCATSSARLCISSLPLPLAAAAAQLLAWMENPVPASRVEQQLKCEKPRDVKADNVCETFVG